MKIIIAPAKKMIDSEDDFGACEVPIFLDKTKEILSWLQGKDQKSLKQLWKCSDQLAKTNFERLQVINLDDSATQTPAVMSYQGIQYQYLNADVMESKALEYLKDNLYILSGFYGVLKAFSGVSPYRLEMQAKATINSTKNLYEFWGDNLYQEVFSTQELVLNLASKEYSKAIEKYLKPTDRFVTCSFLVNKNGKLVQQATEAKKMRGCLLNYLANNQITQLELIKKFSDFDYVFSEELSSANELVFVKKPKV